MLDFYALSAKPAAETPAESATVGETIINNATYFQQQLEKFGDACVDIAFKFIAALIVFFVGIFLIKFLLRHLAEGKAFSKVDDTVRNFVFSFIKITLYALLLISVIAIMGVPMSSVIAVLASVGVTIGLALQGSLSNLAGGIMILIFKPFKVGDFIESDGGSGTVTEVSLFYTTLRSLTNERISIPNSTLSNTKITNYSFYDTRRLDLNFSVAYGTDKNAVIETIMSVVNANPKAYKKPEPFLRMTEHAGSGIVFTLRVYCSRTDIFTLKSDLLEDVYDAFARVGIEIPYQTIDINIRKNNE
jgi:small conductance mechanosensitive channel